ncbi:MAG: hypothetical protein AAGH40_02915 [Verrucomicrobiota bacterium]
MNFLDHISVWLRTSLSSANADKIKGYSFNLIENGGEYSVELIGASEFDANDPDWPCEEIFEATPRSIPIPEPVHEGNWESCLTNMATNLRDYLSFGDQSAQILKRADGIAVGFVDGELQIIHPAEQAGGHQPPTRPEST